MQATLTDTTLRVTFDGDLLSTNIDALRTEILAAMAQYPSAQTIVADLTHARLVDSKGFNLLIASTAKPRTANWVSAPKTPRPTSAACSVC